MKISVLQMILLGYFAFGCGDAKEDGDQETEDHDCSNDCADTETEAIGDGVAPGERHLLLRDEGNSVLHYVSLADPSENWHVDIPEGRDIQLVGDGRVMIGTKRGYQEHDIATGEKVAELTSFSGTIAAQRIRNGNTLLVGPNWQGGDGIVLVEVDADGDVVHTIEYSGYDYARLARQTPVGTYLVTADNHIIELSEDGELLWEARVQDSDAPHSWMALRRGDGTTVASCGFAHSLQIFDENGEMIQKITGGSIQAKPFFFSDLQIMSNGNFVISNWQGHGPDYGETGHQLLEYNPDGELVWTWEQDASYISSIQGHIVLDGLNLDKLHIENEDGVLSPVD